MGSLGLLALACGTFALGVAEFSMMGILTDIAGELKISIPEAGEFISAYAIGVSAGAPLPVFFRNFSYKTLLLGLASAIALGNLLAAISPGYHTLVCSRFLAGLPHGGFFGVGAIVAVSLVAPGARATAIAVMALGMTFANLAGVPVATLLSYTWSWRYTFLLAAGAGLLAILGVWRFIPYRAPEQGKSLKREFMFLKWPAPWLIYAAVFLGQGSVYCWYSYMEPIMRDVARIAPHHIKWVMIVAGAGMVFGGIVCGRLADKFRASLISAWVATLIAPTLICVYFFSSIPWLALILTFIGAAALFGLGGPLQYLIVRFSRGGEILGGAGIQIAFNVSNAFAAWIGGLAISGGLGLTSPALFGIPMAMACAAILFLFAHKYKKHGA
ncbi:MAG: MFS transporter [Desulfovibrio sp.]|nr:MFS transporter [Desulfovibrio sp.]